VNVGERLNVFEIPIDKVFEVTGDSSSIESFKLTFKGLNEISLNELKGKLFLFLKILIVLILIT
jgi:hypothetical protein